MIPMVNRIVLNTISYHGKGAIENIVPELTSRGYTKAFVCSDPDLIKFGVTKKVTDLLDAAGFAYTIYSDIKPNPTIENVQHGVAAYQASGADSIVTIGGGSSMDTAKAIGIIVNNPEFADVRSLEGVAPTKKHAVFTIAVPTTAGTAAEVTINYVITDVEKHRKFVCVDTNDIPEVAVVDPDMMRSMPKGLTAATGMDALTHAIEGYITKGHCAISDMFHLEAIRLISKHLRGAVENTEEGREGMALGQYIAGMGFSNVGLGIVHSMAHGLSALYDTPHGVACAIILPTGLEYNKTAAGDRYRAIGQAMGVAGIDAMSEAEAIDATIAAVKQLSADVGIPAGLQGILKEEDVAFLSASAYADACRPGNPRDTNEAEIAALYRSLM
jgi:lactaldehyde reductase